MYAVDISQGDADLFSAVVTTCGYFYVLYCITFRWQFIRNKYGTLDLLFWVQAVMIVFWLIAAALIFAIWLGAWGWWYLTGN